MLNENKVWPISYYALAVFFLGFTFVYIFSLIMDPRCSWVLPEAFYYKSYIMQNIPLKDTLRGTFNNLVFEYTDRITRPLSSMFEIIDTHFRAWLWQFTRPVTSLSLTFIFSLILSPILYFKFLKNLGIRPSIAIFATAIMLLNPATLSLVVMLFRPAKVMMNFWLIFSLYFASRIYLHDNGTNPDSKVLPLGITVGIGILLGFLFDETAVVIAAAILFLFPTVFLRNYKRVLGFALVPLTLLSLYIVIFPDIAAYYGYQKPNLLTYSALTSPALPPLTAIFSNFLNNAQDITFESLGMFNPANKLKFQEQLVFFLLMFSSVVFLDRFYLSAKAGVAKCSPAIKRFVVKAFFLIIALYMFHTVLLDTVGDGNIGRVWGPYWYGAYFGIFWGIFLGLIGEATAQIKNRVSYSYAVVMSLICLGLMVAFPYTNFVYRLYHFYPYHAGELEQVYRGKVNRFDLYDPKVFGGKGSLMDVWHGIRKGKIPTSIRKEYYWIPVEMGVLNQYPVPNNETVTFNNATKTEFPIPLLN